MKDKLIGLAVLALIVLGFIIFSGGSSDDKKEETKKEPDAALVKKREKQVEELNKWYENYTDSGIPDDDLYRGHLMGYSADSKGTLFAVFSKRAFKSEMLTEKEVAKYAFVILQDYPGELTFENLDENKELSESVMNNPKIYTVFDR